MAGQQRLDQPCRDQQVCRADHGDARSEYAGALPRKPFVYVVMTDWFNFVGPDRGLYPGKCEPELVYSAGRIDSRLRLEYYNISYMHQMITPFIKPGLSNLSTYLIC
jgi:hypothetical protein